MNICRWSLIVALFVFVGVVKADNKVSLESAPPVVVKTVPQAGSDDVDPKLKEIKVTFSKEMTDHSWSWSTWGDDTFPDMKGEPRYLDDKWTCVITVELKPGKTYAIWVNSANFHNFKDAAGNPAVPYLLVFKTKWGPAQWGPM